MAFSLFLSFFIYAFITAITPGPNNILALNAVLNFGIKNAKNCLLGIYVGFTCVMFLCGFVSNLFLQNLPNFMPILKYFGVAYIFYLAFKVATTKPPKDENTKSNISFLAGFFLQFINIKIILYAITIFVSFVFPFYQSWQYVVIFAFVSSVIGILGISLWAFMGVILKRFLQKYYKITNLTMAFLLISSAVQIFLQDENINFGM